MATGFPNKEENISPIIKSLTLPNFAKNKITPRNTQGKIGNVPKEQTIRKRARTPGVAIVNMETNVVNKKTPIQIPKIGIPGHSSNQTKNDLGGGIVKEDTQDELLQPEENPWLVLTNEGTSDVKITGVTPIGTIAKVPTLDKRPVHTPRRLLPPTPTRHLTLCVIDENTGNAKIDPLLTATIYLDCTRPEDQDYNHVANKMRSITESTTTLQKQYINELKALPAISGNVSHDVFEYALSIYENNQVYYQDRIDDCKLDTETIKQKLTELEHWFMCIIEPNAPGNHADDIIARKEREEFKLNRGISRYCDPELYPYITPANTDIRSFICKN